MSAPQLQGALLFLVAAFGYLLLGVLVAWGIVTFGGPRIARCEPRARHAGLVTLAALPVVSSVLLVSAASLPAIVALFVPGFDHCHGHEDAHVHLCFTHLPAMGANLGVLLLVAAAVAYVAVHAIRAALRTRRALRVLASMAQTAEHRSDIDARVLETDVLVCFAAGLTRPQVFVSRGFLDAFDDEQRAIVLAHELAHVRRRDAFFASLVRACTVVHVPSVRRWLVQELDVAAEQACDEEAARTSGDRLAVADTIVAVERAAREVVPSELGSMAVAFAECATERRVMALLEAPRVATSMRPFAVSVALMLGFLVLASNQLHHLTESLLSILAS